jgi:hypothetical protein
MENVFEELLAGGTTVDDNGTIETEENDFDHSYDLNLEDLVDEGEENNSVDAGDEGEAPVIPDTTPTNNAFAQMRTENKQYSQKIAEIDALAKSLGMENIDDFIAKAKDAQTQLEAKKTGVPVEFAKEIAEIRALKNDILAERQQNVQEARERQFVSNVDAFVKSNKLSEAAVNKLSQDLENDGLEIEALMDMPAAALNRILSSYVGTNYQKNLERKDTIRKELPINQASKVDAVSLNREIDDFARQLAGK